MKIKNKIIIAFVITIRCLHADQGCSDILYVPSTNGVTHDCKTLDIKDRPHSDTTIGPTCTSSKPADISYPPNSYCTSGSSYANCSTEEAEGTMVTQAYTCALGPDTQKYWDEVNVEHQGSISSAMTDNWIAAFMQALAAANLPGSQYADLGCQSTASGPPDYSPINYSKANTGS